MRNISDRLRDGFAMLNLHDEEKPDPEAIENQMVEEVRIPEWSSSILPDDYGRKPPATENRRSITRRRRRRLSGSLLRVLLEDKEGQCSTEDS